MKLHNVLESIFGSPAKVRILRVMAGTPQPLSGRQVGELAGLTHRGAIQALTSLVDIGAVKQRKAGNAYQYTLSKDSIFVKNIVLPVITAEAKVSDELRQDIIAHFGKGMLSLILFGSLARSEEVKGSDIDVMAVVKDENEKSATEEKVAAAVSFFHEKYKGLLSVHCFTVDEIKRKKTLPLIRNVIKEGVVLAGRPLTEWCR